MACRCFYDKLGNADSTAKYALLSYELDDSLCTHLMKSGCSIQQTQYEHNRLQSEISRKEQKAQHATITALAAALGLVLAVFTFILIIKRRHAEAERKQRQYAQDNERLTQAQTTLQALLAQTEEERNTLAEEYRKTIDELTSRKKTDRCRHRGGKTAQRANHQTLQADGRHPVTTPHKRRLARACA